MPKITFAGYTITLYFVWHSSDIYQTIVT